MKLFNIFFIVLFGSQTLLFSDEKIEAFASIKEKIIQLNQQLCCANTQSEKAHLHYQLSLAYFHDQELDVAFQHFLTALKQTEYQKEYLPGKDEAQLYEKALNEYLQQSGVDPVSGAKNLLENYQQIAKEHSDYLLLNFLLSTAHANLGQFLEFFEKFYQSYDKLHDTFLSYKTQGILFLRLAQRGNTLEEKQNYMKDALVCLNNALCKNAADPGLYKLLIFLAKDNGDDQLALTYLKKMVESHAPFSRADICFYVKEAADLGEYALAEEIVQRATSLYEYSRSIEAAKSYLNQKQGA